MAMMATCVNCCERTGDEQLHVIAIQVAESVENTDASEEEPVDEQASLAVSQEALQSMEERRSSDNEKKSLERSESGMSPESLSVNLRDFTLLRGTSLRHILHRCGRHFSMASLAAQTYSPGEGAMLYAKSQPVKKLDFFISHSWRDDRFGKILALWIHSNLHFAMAVSTTVAVSCAVLARVDILPRHQPESSGVAFFPWALFLGSVTFFWALACSHHVHVYLWDKSYFLDKFCVHQTDLDLKQRGVTSFAAFVGCANRVLLLWSPQYFTRLWCTLEVAALVKANSGKPLPLDFLPLQLAKISFISWVLYSVTMSIVQTNRQLNHLIPDLAFICLVMAVASYLLVVSLRQYGRARQALEMQLRTFAVQEADCFSSSDRRAVEKALLRWFANLDVCNKHIREGVSDQVLQALGSEVHYPMKMLLPIVMINFFSEADYIAGRFYDEDTLYRLATMLGWSACLLVIIPLSHRLCYCFCDERSSPLREVLTNISLGALVALMWVVAFVVNYRMVDSQVLSGWLLPLPVLEWLAFFYLQRGSFKCCKG